MAAIIIMNYFKLRTCHGFSNRQEAFNQWVGMEGLFQLLMQFAATGVENCKLRTKPNEKREARAAFHSYLSMRMDGDSPARLKTFLAHAKLK
jgi:hypothetical protein